MYMGWCQFEQLSQAQQQLNWHCVVLAVRGYENMKLPQSVEELKIYTVRSQWFVENSRAVSSL